MAYLSVFVMPVPTDRIEDYRRIAETSTKVFMEFGALSVVEAKADNAPEGEVTSFPRSVQLEEGETVVLGFATFKSRAQCDEVTEKFMADARIKELMPKVPTDGKRMFWGGFETMVVA